MNEFVTSTFVLLLGALVLSVAVRKLTRFEQRVIALTYAAHFLAGIAQVVIARGVYGGGDNLVYMSEGSLLARAIEIHPARFGRLWLDILLQRETNEAIEVLGQGSSTGTMIAITAALALVLRYSLYGACLSVAVIAFLGKLVLYRVFRELLPEMVRARILIAVLAMPSAVFWSAGIQKEAFVVASMGPLWLGVHRILHGRPVRGAIFALIGVLPIALLKPYTLFALAIAAGVWVGLDRLRVRQGGTGAVRVRPVYLIVGAALAFGGVIVLGRVFPHYSTEKLAEDLAHHQHVGAMLTATMDSAGGGASYYSMGNESSSLQEQIAFAPLAAATALFRPLPFEANNGLAFVASLETFALTSVVCHLLARVGPRRAFAALMSSPVLCASLVFAVLFGMGVGLATTNFGSLSRYRMPLIPFYATLVLVLGARPRTRARARASPKGLPVTLARLPRESRQ
jgi:TM2 domain-containing membrane protein YozV